MKLERLNENQIRCTLDKSDLDQRELRISELAYGSAKARELFQDMMQQASLELGFEVENIPLVIEAVPVSGDCLILVVTKVEDPEELDQRFSHLARLTGGLLGSPYERSDEDELPDGSDGLPGGDTDDIIALTDEDYEGIDQNLDPLGLLAPFAQALTEAKKHAASKEEKKKNPASRLYLFHDLDQIISLSGFLAPFYTGDSLLYKDTLYPDYYLFLNRGEASDDYFKRACTIASDYGEEIPLSYASEAYCKEHCQVFFDKGALEALNRLN